MTSSVTVIGLAREDDRAAANSAAQGAHGDLLVFLSEDVELEAGALELLAEQVAEADVGAVGARVLNADGTLHHAGVLWRAGDGTTMAPLSLFEHGPGDLPATLATYDLSAVTGGVLAVRRELFLEIGGFEGRLRGAVADLELCARMRAEQLRVVYRGDAAAVRHQSEPLGYGLGENADITALADALPATPHDESTLLTDLFDAHVRDPLGVHAYPPAMPGGTAVTVEGFLTSLAPEAAEARALLALFERCGARPAARGWEPSWFLPRLDPSEAALLEECERRQQGRFSITLHVPCGALVQTPNSSPLVLRVAASRPDLDAADAVWTASPGLARELRDDGLPAERVSWIPPVIPALTPGEGGAGVLALLPTHDPQTCATVLDALSPFREHRVRLIPSVANRLIGVLARELLPTAELLAPVSAEADFAALAGDADIVVCADRSDAFERRALLSAATGAAAVSLRAGPASAVLGDALCVERDADAATFGRAIACALDVASDRVTRRQRVQTACSPNAVAPRMSRSLDELAACARPHELAEIGPARDALCHASPMLTT